MLYYHKCNDCLTAFSTEEKHVDMCDCNGSVTFMGQVQGDKYVLTVNKPACDGRCTHAAGPHCDCQCGGANHGTGKLVPTVIREGKVCITGLTEEDIERAQVYRRFREAAETQLNKRHAEAISNHQQRVWSDRTAYTAWVRARAAFEKACGMKLHGPRITALINVITTNKV